MWLIFPVLVLSKFNELLKVQREIRAALLSANVVELEIAKASMVNNCLAEIVSEDQIPYQSRPATSKSNTRRPS